MSFSAKDHGGCPTPMSNPWHGKSAVNSPRRNTPILLEIVFFPSYTKSTFDCRTTSRRASNDWIFVHNLRTFGYEFGSKRKMSVSKWNRCNTWWLTRVFLRQTRLTPFFPTTIVQRPVNWAGAYIERGNHWVDILWYPLESNRRHWKRESCSRPKDLGFPSPKYTILKSYEELRLECILLKNCIMGSVSRAPDFIPTNYVRFFPS